MESPAAAAAGRRAVRAIALSGHVHYRRVRSRAMYILLPAAPPTRYPRVWGRGLIIFRVVLSPRVFLWLPGSVLMSGVVSLLSFLRSPNPLSLMILKMIHGGKGLYIADSLRANFYYDFIYKFTVALILNKVFWMMLQDHPSAQI